VTPFLTVMDLRTVVGKAPIVWPCADAAVFDEAGRLLLQRRADDGDWGVPGGALDTGETLAQTAQRETREETGIEVEPVQFLGIRAGYRVQYPGGNVAYPIVATFLCRTVGGQLAVDGDESTEVGFFTREHLPPLPPRMQRLVSLAFASQGL
jgi:ADP-ribose pyrophosphatase YjhB (NUDIX family)